MTIDRHNRSRSVVNLNQNVQDLEGEDKIISRLEHTALWPISLDISESLRSASFEPH